MKVIKQPIQKNLRCGDLVESGRTGKFYLIVKDRGEGYSVIALTDCTLHTTRASTPEEAIKRIISGSYTIHKSEDFELTLNTRREK